MTSNIINNDLIKKDPVFGQLSFDGHEQIVFCNDEDTGLKAIIGIQILFWVLLWEVQECGLIRANGML